MTWRVSITLLLLFWLGLVLPLHGQQPAPSPAAQTPPPDSQDVVRITTNLVQVDVVVTKNGKPVTDLQAEDFEILQDGKPQTITNFSYVSNAPGKAPAKVVDKAKNKTVLPVPPAKIDLNDQRRTVALVIDDLGMSWESIARLRGQVKKFLTELSPHDLVAIIRTGGDVGALQQFTNDQRLLQSAADHIRWNPCSRAGLYVFQPVGRPGGDMNTSICSVRSLGSTLGSLKFILRGMGYLPGRKSMVVFSDLLPIEDQESEIFLRPGRMTGPNDQKGPGDDNPELGDSYYAQYQKVAELAIRASVVIYSVDTRGLQTTGLMASDRLTSTGQAGLNNEIMSILRNRSAQLTRGREGSDLIARQTGGFLIRNSNDSGLKEVMEDQQGYYLIGFRPSEETFNREFHRIKAKVKRGGLTVRTRTGFYGVTNEQARPTQLPVSDRMNKALLSPFSTSDVNLRLTSLFVHDPSQGSLVRSFLYFDPRDLTFREQADGWRVAYLDIRTIMFGDNGRVMSEQDQKGTLRLRGEGYERAMREGLAYSFDIPMKLRGAYQFRVAVRDAVSSRIGAAGQFVEIPDLKNGRPALSGIVARVEEVETKAATGTSPDILSESITTGPAVRRFQQGSSVNFNYAIYNAQPAGQSGQITLQTRLFRDGKVVFNTDPAPLQVSNQPQLPLVKTSVLRIPADMPPGEYFFQVILMDSSDKEKPRVASQLIDFEVVK